MNQKIIISTVLAALLAAGTVSAEGLLHLSWKPDYDAVKYDVTFSRRDHGKMAGTWKITAYMSDMLLPESGQFKDLQELYWQEKPLDFDGYPIGMESGPRPLESSVTPVSRNAPLPGRTEAEKGEGLFSIPCIPA